MRFKIAPQLDGSIANSKATPSPRFCWLTSWATYRPSFRPVGSPDLYRIPRRIPSDLSPYARAYLPDAEPAGQKHCQFAAAAAGMANFYRDKPLWFVWFVAP